MASTPTRGRVRIKDLPCPALKVRYPTRSAALAIAEIQMQRGHVSPGSHIVPYQCPDCGDWHVANKTIVLVGRRWDQGATRRDDVKKWTVGTVAHAKEEDR